MGSSQRPRAGEWGIILRYWSIDSKQRELEGVHRFADSSDLADPVQFSMIPLLRRRVAARRSERQIKT